MFLVTSLFIITGEVLEEFIVVKHCFLRINHITIPLQAAKWMRKGMVNFLYCSAIANL